MKAFDTTMTPAPENRVDLRIRANQRLAKLMRLQNDGVGWCGWDFDRTLVTYTGWKGPGHVGETIEPSLSALIQHLEAGDRVKIFTARIHPVLTVSLSSELTVVSGTSNGDFLAGREAFLAVQRWCIENLGHVLEITCVKDKACTVLYDDIAIQIIPNTGRRADGLPLSGPARPGVSDGT